MLENIVRKGENAGLLTFPPILTMFSESLLPQGPCGKGMYWPISDKKNIVIQVY